MIPAVRRSLDDIIDRASYIRRRFPIVAPNGLMDEVEAISRDAEAIRTELNSHDGVAQLAQAEAHGERVLLQAKMVSIADRLDQLAAGGEYGAEGLDKLVPAEEVSRLAISLRELAG